MIGGNSRPAIGDFDHRRSVRVSGRDLDGRRTVAQRVIDEVGHQAQERDRAQRQLHGFATREAHIASGALLALDHRRDDVAGVVRVQRCLTPVASEVEELTDDPVHRLDVVDHALPCLFVVRFDLDAEAQPRERCAQVVRNAGEEQRAILLDLPQVGQHFVEPAIEVHDFGRAVFGQGRGRHAVADACDCVVELSQRPCEITGKGVGTGEEDRADDHTPFQRPGGRVLRGPRRQLEAGPVGAVARHQLDPEHLQPRLNAQLGLGTELGLQAPLEVDQQGVLRRDADEAPLLIRHNARVIFIAEPSQRRVGGAWIGRRERSAQRVQLHQLGIAELTREQRGAVLTEQVDRRRLTDKNDQQQQ